MHRRGLLFYVLCILTALAFLSSCDKSETGKSPIDALIDSSWGLSKPERQAALLKAISMAHEENDKRGGARAYIALGVFYEQQANLHAADSCYSKGYENSNAASEQDLAISALISLGQSLTYQRKLNEADSILSLALEKADRLDNPRLLGFTHFAFGLKYDRSSDIRSSVLSYNNALSHFRRAGEGEVSNQIRCLNYLGIQYAELGLFDQSSAAYLDAADIALDIGDSAEYISSVYQSGINLIKNGDFDYALARGLQALRLMNSEDDLAKRARILNNVGDAYTGLYRKTLNKAYFDSAFHFVTQSLVLKNEIKDYSGTAYSLHNLGKLQLISGSGMALEYLQRAYEIWSDEKDYANVVKAALSLGEFYLSRDLALAKDYYRQADTLGLSLGNMDARMQALGGLARVAKERGRLGDYVGFSEERDSIMLGTQLMRRQQAVAASEVRLKTLEITKANELLTLENEITARVVTLRTRLMIIISTLLAFSVVISFFFFRNQQRLKTLNDQIKLITQNAMHSQSNGLNVLSSLVRSELGSTDNISEQRLLRDVLNKIDALSGLTRLLFQTNKLGKESLKNRVDIRDYLVSLIEETTQSLLTEEAELETEISSMSVSPKTAFSLGLVLNEMITNSVKYGLTNGEGEISIQLFDWKGQLRLVYTDDGPGFPPGFDFNTKSSFGIRMIHKLVIQDLKGQIEIDSSEEGLAYIITLDHY